MPEGHVTHRMARAYRDAFAGAPTTSTSPQGRFAQSAALLDGRVLDDAESIGKHLFVTFGPDIVHIHLGMAGKAFFHHDSAAGPVVETLDEESEVRSEPAGRTRPVAGAVRWRLENERAWCDLVGPAACEIVDEAGMAAIAARLGPDPLRADADPSRAWDRLRRSKLPIATLLMDQRVFAGVGNIFRAEVLYRAGMDPMLPGVALKRGEFDALWADLVELMDYAVEHGRIDTIRPEDSPEAMGRPPRQDRHGGEVYVYRRAEAPCLRCGTAVRTEVLAARNLFWCPRCQPLSRRAAAVQARAARRAAVRG